MKTFLALASLVAITYVNAQDINEIIKLFTPKTIPYEAPKTYYTDMYLEDGEESSIPFKKLSNEFYKKIGGPDSYRIIPYAVDKLTFKNGIIGLVVYELETVEQIPYEQGSYVLYILDAKGNNASSLRLSTEFTTSDGGDISITHNVNAEIYFSEFDNDQLIIKRILEDSESMTGEFGQDVSRKSTNYFKILADGQLEDVTVWVNEY